LARAINHDFDRMIRERAKATARIVGSPARKKLVVAGPGTGKSHTFKQALSAAGSRGLALTFIRNLVRDLKVDLSQVADVYTFHGFCKHELHRLRVAGISREFDFYPWLFGVIARDLELLGHSDIDEKALERAFHFLDDSRGLISNTLARAEYYDATSFLDVVYRVLRHLQGSPESTRRFPLVVVDEYQDFSRLETAFIAQLAKVSPILVAGDDDQALYSFKHASAGYIRQLAKDPEYTRFGLPYCSRCTDVIVRAVHAVIARARKNGNLRDRLDREYHCFLPDKQEESKQHPKIIHARCSVETSMTPYLCRYVAEEIASIPAADIAESHTKHFPTALVIGPVHFVRRVHGHLAEGPFPGAVLRQGSEISLDVLDGYRRIAQRPASRLGWRILVSCRPFPNHEQVLAGVFAAGQELAAALPTAYRRRHLAVAALIGRLSSGELLSEADRAELVTTVGRSADEVAEILARDVETDAVQNPDPATPTVVCTSLVGAKGLSAAHVFIVGFNNGHFPQHPEAITDEDVCCFIVGLSRTRKACHLVSCSRFASVSSLRPSAFLDWIKPLTQQREVNKDYWGGSRA